MLFYWLYILFLEKRKGVLGAGFGKANVMTAKGKKDSQSTRVDTLLACVKRFSGMSFATRLSLVVYVLSAQSTS